MTWQHPICAIDATVVYAKHETVAALAQDILCVVEMAVLLIDERNSDGLNLLHAGHILEIIRETCEAQVSDYVKSIKELQGG